MDVRLDEIVLRALEKEPSRRYQQANEVKTAVETVVAHKPQPAPEPKPAPEPSAKVVESPMPEPRSRTRWAWAGAALIVVLGVAAVLLLRPQNTASANVFKNQANGHYYERVEAPFGITWDAAKAAAEKRICRGLRGHLVTITSPQEQAFLLASFTNLNHCWYGGYQDTNAPEPGGGWRWVTGEPFVYECWAPNLPDDRREWRGLNANEDVLNSWTLDGQWNDIARSDANSDDIRGYIVEYESPVKSRATSVSKGLPGAGQPDQEAVHPYVAANFVWIKPGTFMMGSPDSDLDASPTEKPRHQVTLTHDFWMGRCEVTQGEFEKLMGYNPSHFRDIPLRPVEQVSWVQAMSYCDRLTHSERAAGRLPKGYVYRLPTEAEWQYACRAGTETRYSFGDSEADLGKYAWCPANSEGTTHPVAQKLPNPWGLYDMHGNVWELCHDWMGSYGGETASDPEGPSFGGDRLALCGCIDAAPNTARSAHRGWWPPTHRTPSHGGFRVVLALPLKSDEATKGPICSPPPGVKVAPPAEAIAQLPGKTLWLKAGIGIVIDTNSPTTSISRWSDQSGKAHDAVSWGNSMPVLKWKGPGDQPSVQFDGADDLMNITGIGNLINDRNNFTVFIRCQMDSDGSAGKVIMSNWSGPWTGFFLGRWGPVWGLTDDWPHYQGTAAGSVVENAPGLISFRSSATDAEFFENGSFKARKGSRLQGNPGGGEINPNPPFVLGRQGIDSAGMFKGHIFELVVFDRCLADEERAQVEACLGVTPPGTNAAANPPPAPAPPPQMPGLPAAPTIGTNGTGKPPPPAARPLRLPSPPTKAPATK